jgi:hypothetical protein
VLVHLLEAAQHGLEQTLGQPDIQAALGHAIDQHALLKYSPLRERDVAERPGQVVSRPITTIYQQSTSLHLGNPLFDAGPNQPYFLFSLFPRAPERITILGLGSMSRSKIMPIFYFHLGFAGRILSDDEGTELPDRPAARAEAVAVMREIAPVLGRRGPEQRADGFLRVADEDGPFLHLPMDRPALEVVSAQTSAVSPRPAAVSSSVVPADMTTLMAEAMEQHEHTMRLMEKNRQLRYALSLVLATSQTIRDQAVGLIACARRRQSSVGGTAAG